MPAVAWPSNRRTDRIEVLIRSMPTGTTMGGAGFEPAKAVPPDLQSGPFGRLGIHPSGSEARPAELAVRLELTTVGLQNRCSAD